MPISPINLSRTSLGLRSNYVLDSLQQNQLDVFMAQAQISSGRSFVTPSEDPVTAARVADLTLAYAEQAQFLSNLQTADNTLAASDDAIVELNSLLIEAQTIASQNVSNLASADERAAEAELIAGIRNQLQVVGNRQFEGRYIFAGRETLDQPFVDALGGVAYIGDTGELVTRTSEDREAAFSIPGNVLFGALSSQVGGAADLTPLLSEASRLDELNGATGQGVQAGPLVFNEPDGVGRFSVDITSADTIGDVASLISEAAAEAGSALTASVSNTGLVIAPGAAAVSITDSSGGAIAGSLGVLTPTPTTASVAGEALGPRLTRLTPVDAMAAGAGVDLSGGLVITNGTESVTLDVSAAESVQDIINVINNSGMYVIAQINEAGTGIEVVNQVSGGVMTIGENGGTTASDLGIRTLDRHTPLSDLNHGEGVGRLEGEADLRITAKDGSTVDVNLDDAQTLGDVIDLINTAAAAAGAAVQASLAEVGNGIRLTDSTGGTGDLAVAALNLSPAAQDLGLLQSVSGADTELVGDDTNTTRTESILDSLIELERALRNDDTRGITDAAQRLDPLMEEITRIHGVIGARAQAMQAEYIQMQDASTATQIFLSQAQDVDYSEAVTQMQTAQTRLQASLQVSSVLMNLSLMDFLQ